MNTTLIRKIIASDLPRREQDLLILLVIDYNSIYKKKTELDAYYNDDELEYKEIDETSSECENDSDSDTSNVHSENDLDCDDHGNNKAMRAEYEERHGRILSGSELAANADAERSISRDDSKVWGLQFPSNTIWGNWVHSYNK
jgi:hypothetical protein